MKAKSILILCLFFVYVGLSAWRWPISNSSTPDTFTSAFGPRDKSSSGFTYNFHKGMDLQ